MLNRRFLRIKAFHALYAYEQGDAPNAAAIEKEMLQGIERLFDLYLALLLAYGELRHVAQLRMEERRRKRLPTPEDLNPDRRFVDDPALLRIATSKRLELACQKRRVSWVGEQEIFTRMWREIEASEPYRAFMADPDHSFAKSQRFLVYLLTEHIANDTSLQDIFESRSIHWMEEFDLAASMVKRGIEVMRAEEDELQLAEAGESLAEERAFVTGLFRGTLQHGAEHEAAIADAASNWDADRIALSDMLLMKMAITEARHFEEIPVKVTLNEYIEIAKAYSTPKSKGFINGVLDRLFNEMRADGRIRKVGRGLLES
jgi:N utilization substance protein B